MNNKIINNFEDEEDLFGDIFGEDWIINKEMKKKIEYDYDIDDDYKF